MTSGTPPADRAEDYAFRFDLPIEPLLFGGELDVHGWLLHRKGKPIHGIRALVKRRWRGTETVRARRKRERPDVAAAFPHLADALASGFLIELRLGLGRSDLTFQVQDHEKTWCTFATGSVSALPLALLNWSGLTNVRRFLIFYMKQWFARRQRVANITESTPLPAGGRTGESDTPLRPISTKRIELFATSKSNLFIIEIGDLVTAGFRELGCDATLHIDGVPDENPPDGTLQIVVTPHEYYNLFLTPKLPRHVVRQLTSNVYLLCTEQPETGWFQSNLRWGSYARGVLDINPLGVAAYRARGLAAHQLQLGYHSMLAHSRKIPHRQRDCEITFLGSLTERRETFFAEHAQFFAQHRCHLRFVPLGFAKTIETKSYLDADRRNQLLSHSRILLNVHYSEQKYFEWHRMLVGLANGCCIVTETCKGYGQLVPGKHFIMVEPEYLVPCCEYYLAHPDECERIAMAGLEFVESELRQSRTCADVLHNIKAAQALDRESSGRDPVPLSVNPADAAPIVLSSGLAQKLSRHTRSLFIRAFRRDLRALLGKTRAEPPRVAIPDSNSEKKLRAAVIDKREAYKARLTEQEELRQRGEPVFRIEDNDALTHCTEPRLSVLITLYNYAHHIEECMDSVARAAEQLDQPPEIVIVNDASTDKSLSRALECQQRSTLPVRLVDKQFNTGLADARNTGLRIARAPYVFMMDADNLIYPQGLRQLLDLISQGDYVASYSMLCRFRGTPANRVGLLSYFDFDPQILVQYPYVDAMAMFRRETLLELGGYDNQLSQIGWFGWEDYDMWLNYAQRNLPVAFLPNTLCLYRHHETSMINTTNLFESDLVHHFMVRHGNLLNRFEPRATVFGVDRRKIAEVSPLRNLANDASAEKTEIRS